MAHVSRSLPLALAIALASCGTDLPQTPYSASTGCIELRFEGARASGDEVLLGKLVARAAPSADCGDLASVRTRLFVDANGNGQCDENELRDLQEDPPKEFMRSIHISQRTVVPEGGTASLSFLVEVETSTGEAARVFGPVEN